MERSLYNSNTNLTFSNNVSYGIRSTNWVQDYRCSALIFCCTVADLSLTDSAVNNNIWTVTAAAVLRVTCLFHINRDSQKSPTRICLQSISGLLNCLTSTTFSSVSNVTPQPRLPLICWPKSVQRLKAEILYRFKVTFVRLFSFFAFPLLEDLILEELY